MALTSISSETDICNLAMIHLKDEILTSVDTPESDAAQLCNQVYHHVRQVTLRSHVWNFATKRIQLTPDASVPLFGFTRQYSLPSDWLRYVRREDTNLHRIFPDQYAIEDGKFLLNAGATESINLIYIYDAITVSKFDPLFVNLFAINMAILLAPKFSASESKRQTLAQLQLDIKAEATAIDGQEQPPVKFQKSKWLRARRTRPTNASPFIHFE